MSHCRWGQSALVVFGILFLLLFATLWMSCGSVDHAPAKRGIARRSIDDGRSVAGVVTPAKAVGPRTRSGTGGGKEGQP